eukprot:m.50404 g.50404  ORF g.50404 m.50404 type:complete len:784 (+) comp10669_c0_seq1:87-2438(+)
MAHFGAYYSVGSSFDPFNSRNDTQRWFCGDTHGFEVWEGDSFGNCFLDLVAQGGAALLLLIVCGFYLWKAAYLDPLSPKYIIASKRSRKKRDKALRYMKLASIFAILLTPIGYAWLDLTPVFMVKSIIHVSAWVLCLVCISNPAQLRILHTPCSRELSYEPISMRICWVLGLGGAILEAFHNVQDTQRLVLAVVIISAYSILLLAASVGMILSDWHPPVLSEFEMEKALLKVDGVKEALIHADLFTINRTVDGRKSGANGLVVHLSPPTGDELSDKKIIEACRRKLNTQVHLDIKFCDHLPNRPTTEQLLNEASKEIQNETGEDVPKIVIDKNRGKLLIGGYAVFFLRYCIATFLSPFFADICERRGISNSMQGIIFSAFPLGIALTASISSGLIMRIGTRQAVFIGILGSALTTILFGVIPDLQRVFSFPDDSLQWGFMVVYFLNGFIGGLAETGTTILLTAKYTDRLGAVTASIGTVCGLGCLAGPPIGGVLYDLPKKFNPNWDAIWTDGWCFRLPFFVFGFFCLVLSLYVYVYFGNVQAEAQDENAAAPVSQVLSWSRLLSLVAIALSGTIVATLDPTLSHKLYKEPYGYDADRVGLVFMMSSMLYIIISVPVGWAIDKTNAFRPSLASSICKIIQATGFFFLALCFVMLGPLVLGKFSLTREFNNVPSAWIAMLLKGVGSAANNAGYPDLAIGILPEDTARQATLSGLWNAAYAAGWAAGPLLGGILYGDLGFAAFCTITAITSFVYGTIMLVSGIAQRFKEDPQNSEMSPLLSNNGIQ